MSDIGDVSLALASRVRIVAAGEEAPRMRSYGFGQRVAAELPSRSGYVPVPRVPSQRAACLHSGAAAASDAPVPEQPRVTLPLHGKESMVK